MTPNCVFTNNFVKTFNLFSEFNVWAYKKINKSLENMSGNCKQVDWKDTLWPYIPTCNIKENYLEQVLGQTPNLYRVYSMQCTEFTLPRGKKMCVKRRGCECLNFYFKVIKRYQLKKIDDIFLCWRKSPKTVRVYSVKG